MNLCLARHLLLCACALVTSGCGAASKEASSQADAYSAETLEGEWNVTAKGKRFDCNGARDEGDIDVTVKPFRVYASPGTAAPSDGGTEVEPGRESEAFVQRIRASQVLLTANIGDDVEFEGGGDTMGAVYFSIREPGTIAYDFDGEVQDVDRATGTFTGTGPGACKSSGTFTLRRQ